MWWRFQTPSISKIHMRWYHIPCPIIWWIRISSNLTTFFLTKGNLKSKCYIFEAIYYSSHPNSKFLFYTSPTQKQQMWDDIHTKGASSNKCHTWADHSTTIMILSLASITYHIHEVSIKAHRDKETKKRKEKKRKNHLQASTNFQLCTTGASQFQWC